MEIKKLAVCGDSFASASVLTPGKHYSEIIADRLGYELVSLARGGMSNLGICLQIEYAIKHQFDFVIVSFTDSSRIEIPFNPIGYNFVNDDDVYTVDHRKFGTYIRREFDASKGLENVVYDHKNYLSSTYPFFNKSPTIRSDNVGSLMWGEYYPVPKEQKIAMQYYLTELFDLNWKAQVDQWCLKSCMRDLVDSGIPFVYANGGGLWLNEQWLPAAVTIDWPSFTYALQDPTFTDPGYHTDEQAQIDLADIFYPAVLRVLNKGIE